RRLPVISSTPRTTGAGFNQLNVFMALSLFGKLLPPWLASTKAAGVAGRGEAHRLHRRSTRIPTRSMTETAPAHAFGSRQGKWTELVTHAATASPLTGERGIHNQRATWRRVLEQDFGGGEDIRFEHIGKAGVITLTRPKALN